MHSLRHYQQSGTFVTVDESTLICHYHPKSRVSITVHSWCCTFYGFGQGCSDTYPSLWHHTEYFHCPENPLCSAYPTPTHPHPQATTDLFTVFIVLPFPACHRVGIIHSSPFQIGFFHFVFLFFLTSLLEYNCFTVVC